MMKQRQVMAYSLSLIVLSLYFFIKSLDSIHPFFYDLHVTQEGPLDAKKVVICFHGAGGNYQLPHPKEIEGIRWICFNFPDHDQNPRTVRAENVSFGTFQELLPAFYVLKKSIVEEGSQDVIIYGYSAGGGALINCLALLQNSTYDDRLKEIGISSKDKEQLLEVLQRGTILLDTPVKSVDELMEVYPEFEELKIIVRRAKANGLDPLENLEELQGLSLNVFLHFQDPDEILSNRKDHLYIERLKTFNALGKTHVLIGQQEGHFLPHPQLWECFFSTMKE